MRSTIVKALCGFALLVPVSAFAGWLDPSDPDVVVVYDTEDTQFAFYNGPTGQAEWLLNYGRASQTRMKGWDDVTALKFDLSAYRGRIVEEAEIHLCRSNTQPIFALVAATINNDWHEGTGWGSTALIGQSCWRWRKRPVNANVATYENEWTFRYSDFSTASFGNYGSLVCYAYKAEGTYETYTSGGRTWIRAKLDPDVVQALILDQYGLMVTDPRGYRSGVYNPRIYTKEQGAAVQPRLYIKFSSRVDTTPPDPVTGLTAQAGPENGQVVLSFVAPADPEDGTPFGYNVRYSTVNDFDTATDVARWRIPRPAEPGTVQRVLIEELTPGQTYYFFVQAYDRAGNGSAVATVTFTLPPAWEVPALADGALNIPDPAGRTVRTVDGVMRYWAVSELIKVNPVTGNRIEDGYSGSGADDYKKANVVWDSATNTISLTACLNEMVGCQLIIERLGSSLTNVRVSVGDLVGPAGTTITADPYVELFQLHYVRSGSLYYPDAAIPLYSPFPTSFNIPDPNHNSLGKNQSVWIDLYVPKWAVPGEYNGVITVEADQLSEPVLINFKVKVSPIEIPDYPTFQVDLNGYGNPWDYGNTIMTCLRYFQVCHKHRMVPNTLPYGWTHHWHTDRAPSLVGAGPTLHAGSWSQFDWKYGRFFDGSAFRPDTYGSPYVGPGQNTPIATFYTTFYESWPIYIKDPVYGYDAQGMGPDYWENLIDTNQDAFFANAPDVWSAYPAGYIQGVKNVVKDWFEHAQAKGWHQTHFQIYLNNKYYYDPCDSLWVLEECNAADDFRAVGFFHSIYRAGAAEANAPDVKWHWRIDISDRWGQNYGQLNNLINLYCMGGAVNWYWRNIKYRRYELQNPEQWWWYGTGPAPNDPGTGHAKDFLRHWAQGLDGGLPYWNCFSTSWDTANALSVVYSGSDVPGFGRYEGPIASIRMKMMRQAEQIIELLNLLSSAPGWSREKVTQALLAKYSDGNVDRTFNGLDEVAIYQLRADLMAELESLISVPGDINGDGHVDLLDLLAVVNAFGTVEGDEGYVAAADLDDNGVVDIADLLIVVNNFGAGA